MREPSAVVAAAGLSRRFGGANKLLAPWDGTTVVGRVVNVLRHCLQDVVVVTGRDSAEVAAAVTPATTVFNARFQEGLGTSLACGVAARPDAAGWLIALGDMPGVSEGVVARLLSEGLARGPDAIVAPVYEEEPGRTGHPVWFGREHFAALTSLSGDEGAKAVIEASRGQLSTLPCPGALRDLDADRPLT